MTADLAAADPALRPAEDAADHVDGGTGRNRWPVGRIVRRAILQCPAQTPVAQAARMMADEACSSIIVVEGGAPVGIWTERDALALDLTDPRTLARPVSAFMSAPIVTLADSVTLEDALPRFRDAGLRHFLVVDAEGAPVGVLSRTDVVRNTGLHGYLTLRTVASVARRRPLEIPAAADIATAARALRQAEAEAALVVEDDGTPYGIITERDILRLVARQDVARPVRDVASAPIVAVPSDAPLLTAQELMEARGIRHLGVEDSFGGIVAILSFTDILQGIETDYLRHLQASVNRQLAALEAGERRQATILDVTQEGYAEIDPQGRITACNAAFCALVGLPREALVTKDIAMLAEGTAAERLTDGFRAALTANRPPPPFDTELRHDDGALVAVRVAATALRDEDGAACGAFAFFTDLTELRAADRRQRELLDQIAQSNAELEAFAYIVSHDLQEPLRMIASYLQLVERRADGLDAESREFIGYAVDGSRRMQSLLTDLLDYSRIDRNGRSFDACDTSLAVESAVRRLESGLAAAGGRVTWDALPVVPGDFPQLVRLFQQLIDNAVKFHDPQRPPRIHVTAEPEPEAGDQAWRFAVRDNGIGLEPRFADRIFQMFQRLHARGTYAGNGIGLAICKRIVERHHGRIWVESRPGDGATFFFTLPKTEAAGA